MKIFLSSLMFCGLSVLTGCGSRDRPPPKTADEKAAESKKEASAYLRQGEDELKAGRLWVSLQAFRLSNNHSKSSEAEDGLRRACAVAIDEEDLEALHYVENHKSEFPFDLSHEQRGKIYAFAIKLLAVNEMKDATAMLSLARATREKKQELYDKALKEGTIPHLVPLARMDIDVRGEWRQTRLLELGKLQKERKRILSAIDPFRLAKATAELESLRPYCAFDHRVRDFLEGVIEESKRPDPKR